MATRYTRNSNYQITIARNRFDRYDIRYLIYYIEIIHVQTKTLEKLRLLKTTMSNKSDLFHTAIFASLNLILRLQFVTCHGKEIPSTAMTTGSVEEFQVNPITRTKCLKKSLTYYIKKIKEGNDYNFYAATDDKFTPNAQMSAPIGKFENQIAYATCKPGWIDQVFVKRIYEGCGIGSVLTSLCLIDSDIYMISPNNEALSRLKLHKKISEAHFLQTNCKRLVGLYFMSDMGQNGYPYSGGYMYLSTAIKMTYEYFVVQLYDSINEKCLPEFSFYVVKDITKKKLFDGKTGLIEDNPGTGKGSIWYFCKHL